MIRSLEDIVREAPVVAKSVLDFPWLADGVTNDESYAIYHFLGILREEPAMAKVVLESPWFSDGVTETERRMIGGCETCTNWTAAVYPH